MSAQLPQPARAHRTSPAQSRLLVARRRPRAAIFSAIDLLEAAERRGWSVYEVAEELFHLQQHLARDLYTATLVRREIEGFLANYATRAETA